jgi:hypothetical protein
LQPPPPQQCLFPSMTGYIPQTCLLIVSPYPPVFLRCVGLYWPAIGTVKSRLVPEEVRARGKGWVGG